VNVATIVKKFARIWDATTRGLLKTTMLTTSHVEIADKSNHTARESCQTIVCTHFDDESTMERQMSFWDPGRLKQNADKLVQVPNSETIFFMVDFLAFVSVKRFRSYYDRAIDSRMRSKEENIATKRTVREVDDFIPMRNFTKTIRGSSSMQIS
jgi:hypothetical protein